jgi:hypothetical protein
MFRPFALLLVLALLAGGSAPVAAAPVAAPNAAAQPTTAARPAAGTHVAPAQLLPPESSVRMTPGARAVAPAATLVRLGTLRIRLIGLAVSVYHWGCGASTVPNLAIRWGCVKNNNKFIAGHAYGVFHPYHLAYARHRLKVGLIATFTDPAGHVARFKLAWVRLVPKTYIWRGLTGELWAWNNTSRAALTLQTCWGSTNAYRIVSRWVQV